MEDKKKILEEHAKKELGAVNYVFTCLDQPRGWKGYMAKAIINGTITATIALTLSELYKSYKRRHVRGPRIVPMHGKQAGQQ